MLASQISTLCLSTIQRALLFLLLLLPGFAFAQAAGLEYRIGPEDILHISVWQEDGLDRKVVVRPDGGITFPLAGEVQVSGRTPLEVQDEIRARLQRVIQNAEVTVAVDKISGYTVSVLGEVKKPGEFKMGRYVDVIQALTLAGGFTPYADSRDIGRKLQQNILLQSGDIVLVP